MARFHLYRYQLLPIQQQVQLTFESRVLDKEELIQRKNQILATAVTHVDRFESRNAELNHRILYNDGKIIIIDVNANRTQQLETRDFKIVSVEDWPSVLVVFNNDPDIQIMAIEAQTRPFRKTQTLAGIVQAGLNDHLRRYLLHISILPIFDRTEFWDIVAKYRNQITQVKFEMVSPNMPSISGALRFDLRTLKEATNTQETTLELKSDKNANLTLDKDDPFISSLVGYAAEGGGSATIKARGIKKTIKTSDSVKEISIDDLDISATTPEHMAEAAKLLDRMLK